MMVRHLRKIVQTLPQEAIDGISNRVEDEKDGFLDQLNSSAMKSPTSTSDDDTDE